MPCRVIDRRTIVPKRIGRYRSFPGWTRTADGDVLLAYRDAQSAPGTWSHGLAGDLVCCREHAAAWSAPEVLYRHEAGLEEMGCGDLTRLADGTILLWSRQWNAAAHRTHGVFMAASDDDGRTFAPRHAIELDVFGQGWAPYGKVLELTDGTLLQGAYGRRAGESLSASACLESRDRGTSWRVRAWVATPEDGKGLNYFEPLMLARGDGAVVCLLRTNGTFYLTRSDDARTWTPTEPAFAGMAAAGAVLADGTLLVAYRGIHETHVDRARDAVKPRRGRLYNARTSADGGATWDDECELDGRTAWQVGSYGMGDILHDGDAVRVVYYTSDEDQCPWIEEAVVAIE